MTDVVNTVDGDASLWVTIAEAARLQKPPVSRAAMHKRVSKLVDAGRLTTRPGDRGTVLVNLVALQRAVRDETDPAQALRNARENAEGDDDDAVGGVGGAPGADASYHKSRARREAFNAENSRLDLEERLGNILFKDDQERRTTEVFRKVRDRFLGLPAKLSERLAAQPDARAIRALLTTEIRLVLEGLAKNLDTMAEAEEQDDE